MKGCFFAVFGILVLILIGNFISISLQVLFELLNEIIIGTFIGFDWNSILFYAFGLTVVIVIIIVINKYKNLL